MGHFISGIVGSPIQLAKLAADSNLHSPSMLKHGLAFLPLSDDHLDTMFPVQGEFDNSMTYLSEALKSALSQLSTHGRVAFVETEYHGGQGAQGATVYDQGKCVFEPLTNDDGAISDALKLFGVSPARGERDEFESIGFCRHRSNEDWIEEDAQN
jgi:hypothetical protein